MSYAIRNDNQGWRAVGSVEDVGPDEYFSPTPIEIVAPPTTYKEALATLNAIYQTDVSKLNQSYALALLSDGPTEAAKLAAIRSQYETRKSQHTAAVAALKIEYGV